MAEDTAYECLRRADLDHTEFKPPTAVPQWELDAEVALPSQNALQTEGSGELPFESTPCDLSTVVSASAAAGRPRKAGEDPQQDGHQTQIMGDDLIRAMEASGILPYLIEEGREAEFRSLYDRQQALYSNNQHVRGCVTVMRHWIKSCYRSHAECNSARKAGQMLPKMPKRVVDLGDRPNGPGGDARLLPPAVKVIDSSAMRGGYIAVSYRWPDKTNEGTMLTPDTEALFAAGLPIALYLYKSWLQSLFVDAFIIARSLGVRYVWIDALCIMQGSGGDWHIEAPKMAAIYQNAFLTLSFVDGTSLDAAAKAASNAAFCSGLSREHIFAGKKLPFVPDKPESVYAWLSQSGNFVARPEGELDTRAWTLQERLLSTRILSVTRDGLFWDCLRHSASDRRPLGIRGDFSPKFRDSDDRKLRRCLLQTDGGGSSSAARGPEDADDGARADGRYLWRRALQDYAKRELTRTADRVIALEGLTQLMSRALRDECVLGVWRGDAPRSLAWFVEPQVAEAPAQFLTRRPGVRGPSWSWASLDDPIQYRLWHPFARHLERSAESCTPCCRVESLQAQRDSDVAFDSYSGELRITGELAEVDTWHIRTNSTPGCHVLLDPRPANWFPALCDDNSNSNSNPRALLDPERNLRERYRSAVLGDGFFVLPIIEGGYSASLQAQYCLLLQPVHDGPGCGFSGKVRLSNRSGDKNDGAAETMRTFRRMGLFVVDPLVSSICIKDPSRCADAKCTRPIMIGAAEVGSRKRCQGKLSTVRIV